MVKTLSAMQETRVQRLGWEEPLEKGLATYSNILAWKIPMDRGAWQAKNQRVAESDMTEQPALSLSSIPNRRETHRSVLNEPPLSTQLTWMQDEDCHQWQSLIFNAYLYVHNNLTR